MDKRFRTTIYGGIHLDISNPDVSEITIEAIAHGLSMTCRWNGNTQHFYSVAEHCVVASNRAPKEHKLALLMHDCEESITGDIITPIKELFPQLRDIESNIRNMLLHKFDITPYDSEIVAKYDREQLEWERYNLIENNYVIGLKPILARDLFLEKYYKYKKNEILCELKDDNLL